LQELYGELYNLLGPRLGAYLVEANIVLTLAGVRGYTEFLVRDNCLNVFDGIGAANVF